MTVNEKGTRGDSSSGHLNGKALSLQDLSLLQFTNARLVSKAVVSEVPRLADDSTGVLELEMQQQQQSGGGNTAMALS